MGPTRSAESAPGKNRISLWIEASRQRPQRKDLAVPPAVVGDPRMDQFIARHVNKLQGTLSCFDRVLFRGYLPFFSGYAMASFLESRGIYRRDVKRFVLTQAYRLKDHARPLAAREGRPYQYFGERTRKEDLARQLAERDGIQEGLVCVFATVEPCRTFSLRWRQGSAFIQSARRRCLILYYYYFTDRDPKGPLGRAITWSQNQVRIS
jgi:hypothetical protein